MIGGGPAGLAAGAEAAGHGLSVAVVDERPTFGGQIFKQPGPGFRVTAPAELGKDFVRGRDADRSARSGRGPSCCRARAPLRSMGTRSMLLEEGGHARPATARRIVIATGAHDRPVVFPGWTLPGVITAGGAQTLVKTQRVLPGRQIVFAAAARSPSLFRRSSAATART